MALPTLTRTQGDKFYGKYSGAFLASNFGAKGDDVADDTIAIRNGLEAVRAASALFPDGSGKLFLDRPHGTYKITGQVTADSFAGLEGRGSVGLNSKLRPATTIKLASATACVVFGNESIGEGDDETKFSPGGGDFDIDGNNTGATLGALQVKGVNEVNIRNIGVVDAGRTGWYICQGQNSTFDNIAVHRSGRAGTGHGLHITGGAGGIKFSRCYVNGTSADGKHLKIDTTPGMYEPYPDGVAHNHYSHCIFETLEDTGGLFDVSVGHSNRFYSCLFAGPDVETNADGCAVKVSGPSWLSFDACNFAIVGNVFKVSDGGAHIRVGGFSVFQASAPIFRLDNCSPVIDVEQTNAYVIPQPLIELIGTASSVNCVRHTATQTLYKYPAAEVSNSITPWAIFKEGDAQARWFIDRAGGQAWGPGGSTYPGQSLYRDAVYGMHVGGGFKHSGRYARSATTWAFVGGTNTYTLDTSAENTFRYAWTGGGSPTFALSNPQDGTEITLILAVFTAPLTAQPVFPAGVGWLNGSPPTVHVGQTVTTRLRYDSALVAWHEIGRAETTTTAQQQVTRYLTAQTNTAYVIPTGAKVLEVTTQAGGGGGGSGRRGAAASVRCGGGGGSAGATSRRRVVVADLLAQGITTLYVTVGVGGAGAPAIAVNDTNGSAGSPGALSSVRTTTGAAAPANTITYAGQGLGGGGGTNAAGAGGGAAWGDLPTAAGAAASGTGGTGGGGGWSNYAPPSGGAGGGITAADAPGSGGASGTSAHTGFVTNAGATAGNNGADAAVPVVLGHGQSGSGGGASITAAAGRGGHGVRGAGGGGGGASLNGNNSGAGGNGGDGYVEIVAYF